MTYEGKNRDVNTVKTNKRYAKTAYFLFLCLMLGLRKNANNKIHAFKKINTEYSARQFNASFKSVLKIVNIKSCER